jgi:hypothetical protein
MKIEKSVIKESGESRKRHKKMHKKNSNNAGMMDVKNKEVKSKFEVMKLKESKSTKEENGN